VGDLLVFLFLMECLLCVDIFLDSFLFVVTLSSLLENIERSAYSFKQLAMDTLIKQEDAKQTSVKEDIARTLFKTAVDICFTQMSASKGIKEYGEQAIAAMIKELRQLVDGTMPGKP
jgi:hypothetical protein